MYPFPQGAGTDKLSTIISFMILSFVVVVFHPMATAQETTPERSVQETVPDLRHALEDMQFAGTMDYQNSSKVRDDVIRFEDGMFWSETCRELGFAPTPYWVRRDEEGLHFRAVVQSPENGRARFRGVFDGEFMRVSVHWTKERWYWTLEKTVKFTGRPLTSTE